MGDNVKSYCNPIKKQGDFADPFVLRYNGKYYLYATNPDIRCWSSVDLLEWEPKGASIGDAEFPGLVPFAPEVVYHNGAFYMYTSPSGHGHYVLKAASPTGPFVKITGNVGHSIDGSVFIDDDGQWYFYWADDAGILCCKMSAPDKFGEPMNTGAFLHGWTEGPLVVKENGLYYMTYTGNHYLSAGYRIHAAVSEHPCGPYREVENNPVLVHTSGDVIGLGHSSTVWGPDLTTRYIVYHNMNADLTRDLDIDAIELRDGRVQVAGPSRGSQPAPALPLLRLAPDESGFADGWNVEAGDWERQGEYFVSEQGDFRCRAKQALPEQGAAECNLFGDATRYGLLLGAYTLRFEREGNAVCLGGPNVEQQSPLPTDYRHEALHCVLLRCGGVKNEIFLDGRLLFALPSGGDFTTVGLFAEDGSVGVGCVTLCAADKDAIRLCHPVPCELNAEETVCLNIRESGQYVLTVLARHIESNNNELNVSGPVQTVCQPYAQSDDCAAYRLNLPQGLCELTLAFGQGISEPRKLFVDEWQELAKPVAASPIVAQPTGKCATDMPAVADCRIEYYFDSAETTPESELGVLFRASELARGGEGEDEELGFHFFVGYCAAARGGQLVLTRHRYDSTELARATVGDCGSITVEAKLNDIRVYCNGGTESVLHFHDSEPILYGRAGVRAANCKLKSSRMTVTEI